MEGEPVTTKISTPILSSMKRSQLQRLCKKYGLKANGKNTDLQIKLQQYATNSGENIDMEGIEMYNLDIDKSSQRSQYVNSTSEPTTPRTPSVIPLEQQNKVRSSLVDDSPIKMEIEIRENKTIEISNEKTDLNPILLNPAFEQVEINDNMTESKEDEMEDVYITNVDHITNNQITAHLVSVEKADLNPISAFEQVEMNDDVTESKKNEMKDVNVTNVGNNQITDHLISDVKADLNPIFLKTAFEQVEMNDDKTESKENEMKDVIVTNIGHITSNQITDHLISVEKADLNPISAFEQVEMNDDKTESKENEMKDVNITDVGHITNNQITDHLISDEKADLNHISAFDQVEINDDMTESKENEMKDVNITNVGHITNNQITDHLISDVKADLNPISAFEQVEMNDDMTESKENEMKGVNVTNEGHITNNQITDHLVSDEKADLNPISLKPSFGQIEMNDDMTESKEDETKDANVDRITNNQITDHLVSDDRTEQVEMNDISLSKKDIIDSVHKELETRFAILKALPSPERKKILENSKIPTATPLRRNSEVSMFKPTGSSSTNRFAKAHEKAFLQMPSIVTHYAAHKTNKVEENQDEINKKRKDLDSTQPLIKKQKLAHNTQENQVIKSTKDVYKKDEVVKSAAKKASRSSIRPKNIFPNPEEQKKKEREEFEKRKQAARNVAQPVLEKMKNRKKSKENAEQKQSTKIIKKSILPRRMQQ